MMNPRFASTTNPAPLVCTGPEPGSTSTVTTARTRAA